MWIGPAILVSILLITMVYLIAGLPDASMTKGQMVGPKVVGNELFRPYLLAVELAGFLLLAALIGAYHLGRRYLEQRRETLTMAIEVPVEQVLMVAAGLFLLGLLGVLVRRNIIFLLMSLEVMMNSAGLAVHRRRRQVGVPRTARSCSC